MDIYDYFDSPGYYDFIYGGFLGNRCIRSYVPRFEPKYHFSKQGEMCYVLFKPNSLTSSHGKYVRKLWFGLYILVNDINQATIWKNFNEANTWAKKMHLD